MLRFIVSRLMMALPTIVLVSITVFALIRFIPGDPAALMLGDMAQPEQIAPILAFLASAEHTVITGQMLFVDGGADSLIRGDDIW